MPFHGHEKYQKAAETKKLLAVLTRIHPVHSVHSPMFL
jgi:hypothetical protein